MKRLRRPATNPQQPTLRFVRSAQSIVRLQRTEPLLQGTCLHCPKSCWRGRHFWLGVNQRPKHVPDVGESCGLHGVQHSPYYVPKGNQQGMDISGFCQTPPIQPCWGKKAIRPSQTFRFALKACGLRVPFPFLGVRKGKQRETEA